MKEEQEMEAENIKTAEKSKSCDSIKMLVTLEIIQLDLQIGIMCFLFPTIRGKEETTTIKCIELGFS